MTNMEFQSLIEKARKGEADAEEGLFDRHVGQLTRLAQARLSRRFSRRIDAEDIVQSVFSSFFRNLRDGRYELHGDHDVQRLLASMTVRTIHRQIQWHTAAKRTVHAEHVNAHDDVPRWPPERPDHGPTPDAAVEAFDELNHIFDARPASHRAIVELRLNGEPIGTIARTVPCCQRTVHRVLAKFKQDVVERFAI